jgi:DNA-binding PadR family transcriptional regulator
MKSRSKLNTRNAILGVLMQGPAHGYRIKKLFAPFIAKDGINDGQLYPILTQLEKDKLVRKEIVRQQKSPNKNLYYITKTGQEQFLDWLTGPDDEIDPIKYDFFMQYAFLVKCSFFEHLPGPVKKAKLKRQIEVSHQKIREYRQMRQDMLERRLNEYKIKIVDFGIELQQLKMRWIEEMLAMERQHKGRRTQQDAAKPKRPSSSNVLQPVASRRRPEKKG